MMMIALHEQDIVILALCIDDFRDLFKYLNIGIYTEINEKKSVNVLLEKNDI